MTLMKSVLAKPYTLLARISADRLLGRTGTVTRSSLVRRGIYTPPSKPQALCLTVKLEPRAFISLEPKTKMTAKDIKIDGTSILKLLSPLQPWN